MADSAIASVVTSAVAASDVVDSRMGKLASDDDTAGGGAGLAAADVVVAAGGSGSSRLATLSRFSAFTDSALIAGGGGAGAAGLDASADGAAADGLDAVLDDWLAAAGDDGLEEFNALVDGLAVVEAERFDGLDDSEVLSGANCLARLISAMVVP
jgi:hypothetical protein